MSEPRTCLGHRNKLQCLGMGETGGVSRLRWLRADPVRGGHWRILSRTVSPKVGSDVGVEGGAEGGGKTGGKALAFLFGFFPFILEKDRDASQLMPSFRS